MTPTILVTGVGGGVGQSIVKSLAGSGYRVVGADAEPLAIGLYVVDRGYRIPFASSPDYVDQVLEIARSEGASLVFPGLDAELGPLSRTKHRFAEYGIVTIVSREDVVTIADDKLATAEFLASAGLVPPVTLPLGPGTLDEMPLPLVLKPRRGGARSQGVFLVRSETDFHRALSQIDKRPYVAQEFLDGAEFTCGTVTLDGSVHGPIVMRRTLRDGDTYRAFVVFDRQIEAVVRDAATALQPFGACNFQLRVHMEQPRIFEINARCSGTTYCRALAGFNEPLMIADFLTSGDRPRHEIEALSILRYWKELVVDKASLDHMVTRGTVEGVGRKL